MNRFASQRLYPVLQFTRQVQIFDQRFDFFALDLNFPSLLSCRIRQLCIPLHLFCQTENQRQRCADIMADTGDPVGAGCIPLLDDLIPVLQLRAGLIELFCQFSSKPFGWQFHRAPFCQSIQSTCHDL